MRSTAKSLFFTIVTEPFYVTQIKMFDFGRKNVHDKFFALSLALQIFRCTNEGTSVHF